MNIEPLEGRVVIEVDKPEGKSRGGVILPDMSKEPPLRGKVVAVGGGRWSEDGSRQLPMACKVGDQVIFGKYAGAEHEINDKLLRIVADGEVMAKLVE